MKRRARIIASIGIVPFLSANQADPLTRRQSLALVGGVSLTTMAGWGTTFYLPSVLGRPMGEELGLSPEVLFGGVTLMLVISAFLSPGMGRRFDRDGVRLSATLGSLVLSTGLLGLALAQGLFSYLGAFALFGIGSTLAMGNAPLAAVAQGCPEDGRRPITLLMLISGLSSGVFWPLTGWLAEALGWRGTLFAFAALHAFVCAPIHALAIRRSPAAISRAIHRPREGDSRQIDDPLRNRAFLWIVIGAGVSGLGSWGIPLQFIPMFQQAGLVVGTAILLASIQSPAAMAARTIDLALASRVSSASLVALASFSVPVSLLLIAQLLRPPINGPDVWLLALCIVIYGASLALITAARSTLPLELFGPDGYATLLGRMTLWLNLLFSMSPLLFAVIRERGGSQAVLMTGFVLSVISAFAFWRLERLASRREEG